jgi:hypothetical protein
VDKEKGERKKRAAALHEQIEQLKQGKSSSPSRPSESPAAFVDRRMKELAEKSKSKKQSGKA